VARLVKHDRSEPYKVEQGEQAIWICGCGLSKKKPFCDGSHKKTRDEEPGSVYLYDAESRVKVPSEY